MSKDTFEKSMLAESTKYFGEYDEYEDDRVGGEKQDYTIEDKYEYILGLMNNIPSDQLRELAGMVCGEAFEPDEDDRVVFAKCADAMDKLMATQNYDKIKDIFDIVKTDDIAPVESDDKEDFGDDDFAMRGESVEKDRTVIAESAGQFLMDYNDYSRMLAE